MSIALTLLNYLRQLLRNTDWFRLFISAVHAEVSFIDVFLRPQIFVFFKNKVIFRGRL